MSYYTHYKLDYEIPDTLQKDVKIYIYGRLQKALNDESFTRYGPLMNFIIRHVDRCRWYSHDDDMKEFSNMFPEILFILSGGDEEIVDLWKKYYKGGKHYKAKATVIFDEFDETKLK